MSIPVILLHRQRQHRTTALSVPRPAPPANLTNNELAVLTEDGALPLLPE